MKAINFFKDEYSFLSNFYKLPNGITTEHLYQAYKAKNKIDEVTILLCESPGKAKKLGNSIEIKENWEDIKDKVMFTILIVKFNILELKKLLLDTKDDLLIEGNYWHDNYWGDCYCEKCKNIKGRNKLGKMLMIIRNSLNEKN